MMRQILCQKDNVLILYEFIDFKQGLIGTENSDHSKELTFVLIFTIYNSLRWERNADIGTSSSDLNHVGTLYSCNPGNRIL